MKHKLYNIFYEPVIRRYTGVLPSALTYSKPSKESLFPQVFKDKLIMKLISYITYIYYNRNKEDLIVWANI